VRSENISSATKNVHGAAAQIAAVLGACRKIGISPTNAQVQAISKRCAADVEEGVALVDIAGCRHPHAQSTQTCVVTVLRAIASSAQAADNANTALAVTLRGSCRNGFLALVVSTSVLGKASGVLASALAKTNPKAIASSTTNTDTAVWKQALVTNQQVAVKVAPTLKKDFNACKP
jgi:hypothetical protein